MILKDIDINKIDIERSCDSLIVKLFINGSILMALNEEEINYSRWVLHFFNSGLSLGDSEKLFERIIKTPYKEMLDYDN